jgi:ribosomal protein L15E
LPVEEVVTPLSAPRAARLRAEDGVERAAQLERGDRRRRLVLQPHIALEGARENLRAHEGRRRQVRPDIAERVFDSVQGWKIHGASS